MRKITALIAVFALIAAGAIALPAASGADDGAVAAAAKGKKGGKGKKGKGKKPKGKTYNVKVLDDYYDPNELKVKTGDKINWKWGDNGNPHNVTLEKGPKRVDKEDYTSTTGAIGIKFKTTFKKPGTYDFLCTLHATVMKSTIEVKGKKKK